MSFDVKLESGYEEALVLKLNHNQSYGRYIPDEKLKPAIGDSYVLTNYSVEYMNTSLTEEAEQELLTEANGYYKTLYDSQFAVEVE